MNNAPFSIGQKVVALMSGENESGQRLMKGAEYTVKELMQCPCCGHWLVCVGLPAKLGAKSSCPGCRRILPVVRVWASYKFFAPIQNQYADATSEILEKFPVTEGGEVDKILNPEKATA